MVGELRDVPILFTPQSGAAGYLRFFGMDENMHVVVAMKLHGSGKSRCPVWRIQCSTSLAVAGAICHTSGLQSPYKGCQAESNFEMQGLLILSCWNWPAARA